MTPGPDRYRVSGGLTVTMRLRADIAQGRYGWDADIISPRCAHRRRGPDMTDSAHGDWKIRLRVAASLLLCVLAGSCTAYFSGYSTLALLGLAKDEFAVSPVVLPLSLVIGGVPIVWAISGLRSALRDLKPKGRDSST